MMRGGILLIFGQGSKVKVNFGTLSIKPCGHDVDYILAQSLPNFTCKLLMVRGGTIDFGSRGQRSRSTLALYV